MSRRQRHLDELRHLCGAGAVDRAIDLALQHFADFGPDDEVISLLAAAVARCDIPDHVRRRYVELVTAGR
jgi:hypothetical protein